MRTKLNITEGIFPMPVLMVATYNEDGSLAVETKFENGKAVSGYAMIQEHKIDLSPEDLQALSQPQSEQPLQ